MRLQRIDSINLSSEITSFKTSRHLTDDLVLTKNENSLYVSLRAYKTFLMAFYELLSIDIQKAAFLVDLHKWLPMESMTAFEIVDPHHYFVENFFLECQRLGFKNNTSAEKIKYNWATTQRSGKFWGLRIGEKMISMAGCHHLPEINANAFRIQFRGCELPGSDLKKTLSRAHFNSSTFRELLPLQIQWVRSLGEYDLYITVNHDNRNHRAMELMARQGFLSYADSRMLFDTPQTIWKFNTEYYETVRKKIRSFVI